MSDVEVAAPEVDTPAQVAPPAEVSATAPEGSAPTETAPPVEAPQPERVYSQSELDRILAKNHAKTERRAERIGYERAMREAAERELQRLQAPQPSHVQPGNGRPVPEQFPNDYDGYMEALTDWKVDQKLQTVGEKAREMRARQAAEESANDVRTKLSSGSQKYEDFEEVVLNPELPMTERMAEAILDLKDVGNDVAYFLGTHADEARRIAGLSKVQQVREIDKLAEKLTAPPATTKVPPPITPNKGTGAVEKRLDEADYDDFVAIRKRQIAARR